MSTEVTTLKAMLADSNDLLYLDRISGTTYEITERNRWKNLKG